MGRLNNNISALGLFAGRADDELKEKLFDLCEELTENINRLRVIANGCSKHKAYRGYKNVTGDCADCKTIYVSRMYLQE